MTRVVGALVIVFNINASMIAAIPYSPMPGVGRYRYKLMEGKKVLGIMKPLVCTSTEAFYFGSEQVIKSHSIAWLLNGKGISCGPESLYETTTGLYWQDKHIKFTKDDKQLPDVVFSNIKINIKIIDYGKRWKIGNRDLGEWKKIKLESNSYEYEILVTSKNNGLIKHKIYSGKGKLEYSLELYKILEPPARGGQRRGAR